MYINAHDHLSLYKDKKEALKIIEEEEIMTLACSMNAKEYKEIQKISSQYPLIKKGLGIHPWKVKSHSHLLKIEAYIEDCDFIGEIGLDYFWAKEKELYSKQRQIFEDLLILAIKYKKVCNIHTKGAEKDVLDLLQKYEMKAQIIHWYSGPLDLVDDYLALDSFFTISCDIGHSSLTDQIIDRIPLENLLTETDGPTSLEWVNGQYAYPTFVKDILDYIAKRKNLTPDYVRSQVYENYLKLGI